jgi:hypothetical protein
MLTHNFADALKKSSKRNIRSGSRTALIYRENKNQFRNENGQPNYL